MDQQYDYKLLIEAYIEAKREGFLHDDFKAFYTTRLAKLEEAFGLRFDDADKALWWLFDKTVRSYHAIYHPTDGFLEFGAIDSALKKQGELGKAVFKSIELVREVVDQHRNAVLQMLYEIFTCMFGKIDIVVTSADLRELGFDDSTEPKPWDYQDYY